jgi:glyoxylase-like metal-dependent hydrolase (beta-lactamase superfamily II)
VTASTAAGQHAPDHSVWEVKYGERTVRKSDVLHEYAQYGIPDGDLHMTYNFWVIRSEERIVLLDTGYDIARKDWLGEISTTPTPEGLATLGIDPADVDIVITSHYHYDHIGYLGLFTNATVVSGQAEWDHWITKLKNDDLDGEFSTREDLEPVVRAHEEGRLRLVDEPTEIAPGITVHPVGGHCPGELLTQISTAAGGLVMTVDAAHFYEQVEHEWPFFAFTDLDEMKHALRYINDLAARTTGSRSSRVENSPSRSSFFNLVIQCGPTRPAPTPRWRS